MITASKDKAFLEKSLAYGVFQYLIKPVEWEKFNQTMKNYKKSKQLINETKEINQKLLDSIFGMDKFTHESHDLPPGIDSVTLNKVMEIIRGDYDGITTEKTGERMGVSRTTARRYLEYLVGIGFLKAESVYGIVGRPERRYFLTHESNINE